MRLGTLKTNHPDGKLVVVKHDNSSYQEVHDICPNLISAMENWDELYPKLNKVYTDLNDGVLEGTPVDQTKFHSPLPRTYQWLDGSAYIQHIILVRKARGAEPPEKLREVPLMYQGVSDNFLGPYDDIPLIDDSHGMDFEGEVGVILDRVPMGVSPEEALKHIKLLVLINDVSLRGLIPAELAMGFGFLQSKPPSSHAPFAVTPEELGAGWKDGRIQFELLSEYNGKWFGNPNASEMFFHFGQLIAHAAKTRELQPGTILGSGTVSNEDVSKGSSCLAEKRMLEKINTGTIETPFMKDGDTIKIEMLDDKGQNIFGTIFQKVKKV
ncbi:MAG: fumarylacetoacetate hydrolase family protein [Bacteriovoracaceae bacterium]